MVYVPAVLPDLPRRLGPGQRVFCFALGTDRRRHRHELGGTVHRQDQFTDRTEEAVVYSRVPSRDPHVYLDFQHVNVVRCLLWIGWLLVLCLKQHYGKDAVLLRPRGVVQYRLGCSTDLHNVGGRLAYLLTAEEGQADLA